MRRMPGPRIAITLSDPASSASPAMQALKNDRYVTALERARATPVPLLSGISGAHAVAALRDAAGLLITGGADLDPARYQAPQEPHTSVDPARDALDAAAFDAATRRGLPILGICRGMQAINVFAGGSLVQHVAGHVAASGQPVMRHPIRVAPDSALARILDATALEVNSFHHQAVVAGGLAPGLRVAATAEHDGVELVEALESIDDDRWLVGIQCHPERTDTSPPVTEQLWTAFVAACAAAGDPSRRR